jgi:hypothetical protein
MSESSEFDDIASGIVEQYLLFLRGRGPEPDLSGLTGDQQAAMRDQLDIVEALADREPALPPLEQDPVAIRLGLGDDPPPDTGSSASPATDSAHGSRTRHGDVPIRGVLEGLKSRFDGQVTVDYAPVWASWTRDRLVPLAQCSSLGNSLALFASPLDGWADEPDGVAVFLRRHPDIAAVGLVSADAGQAVIVTAADSNRCIDPVRGWLEPGSVAVPDALEHALDRYFERRIPRWDRVASLDEMLDIGDFTSDAVAITETEIAAALRAKPRLAHKKQALQALALLDPRLLAAVIVEVQTTRLAGDRLVERLVRLGEAAAP